MGVDCLTELTGSSPNPATDAAVRNPPRVANGFSGIPDAGDGTSRGTNRRDRHPGDWQHPRELPEGCGPAIDNTRAPSIPPPSVNDKASTSEVDRSWWNV